MEKLKPGDRIDCRVKEASIVGPYRECDEVKTFEIVAVDKHGYYLYVPQYYHVKGSVLADRHQCRSLGIDKKFLNTYMVYIQENMIYRIKSIMDGMRCARCDEFYQMAEPNQPNGTLICYSCRFNPYR